MHRHGNPNRHLGETPRRNAALQIRAGSCDDLALRASREAPGACYIRFTRYEYKSRRDGQYGDTLTEAVKLTKGRMVLEASGGVTQGSIAKIAAIGVDDASSGALTHSAPNFDVALDIDA
jgi:hypothetical protein